jgi:hypothetical protein
MPMKTTMSMAIHFMVTYKSLATMYMNEFENLILNCFFKVEYCHLYKYTIIRVQYLSDNSMTLQGSYIRVGACYEDNNTTIRFSETKSPNS